MYSSKSKVKQALTRGAQVAIVVIVIIIIVGGGLGAYYLTKGSPTTTPTTSGTSPTSSVTTSTGPTTSTTSTGGQTGAVPACTNPPQNVTAVPNGQLVNSTTSPPPCFVPYTSGTVPSTLTYWYTNAFQYLDPSVSYYEQDYSIISSVYETLIAYNGSSASQTVPWLAQSYTVAANGMNANFTLRSGITFQDGEQLNSTAVYFSLNRLLVEDGSSPTSHGSQASWIVQQLVDPQNASTLGGVAHYGKAYADTVLSNDFVQITGPLTFTLHIKHPNAAFQYLLAGDWASIIAPDWVMSHDLAMWTASGSGYTLPNTALSGNSTQMINQYLEDLSSTCNAGSTPTGCGETSLDANNPTLASGSNYAPLAGTGPYKITSFDQSSGAFTMVANPSYWGGGYQGAGSQYKTTAHIGTIQLNFNANQQTRETLLQSAANAGQAATIDLAATNLYDLADKATWNGGAGQLVPNSQWAGKIFFTPASGYSELASFFYTYGTNVTGSNGALLSFQPFSDLRIRLAFSDSVNMTEINADYNNGLGKVANSVFPPGIPPAGAYNASQTLPYSYNPDQSAQLLLAAMEHPLTSFTFTNGTAAPSGTFNNAFGCTALGSNGQCATPIHQTITLTVGSGDTVDLAAFEAMQTTIANISSTYNMGLTINVNVIPLGNLYSSLAAGQLQVSFAGWIDDYPWVVDFMSPMLAAGGAFTVGTHMSYTYLNNLFTQAQAATAVNNITGLLKVTHLMDQFATAQNMYLYTFYTLTFNLYTTQINPVSVAANPSLGYPLFQNLY